MAQQATAPAKQQEPASVKRAETLLEKETRLLIQARAELAACQEKVAKLTLNVEWLRANPIAETVFTQFLEQAIEEKDKQEIESMMKRNSPLVSEK